MIHTCFNVATYDIYMELAEELITLFPHGEHTKVMLTDRGGVGGECRKIARQYTGRSAVIAFTDGFHGRSMMAMTLTSRSPTNWAVDPLLRRCTTCLTLIITGTTMVWTGTNLFKGKQDACGKA